MQVGKSRVSQPSGPPLPAAPLLLLASPAAKKIARGSAVFLTDADIVRDLDAMMGEPTPPSPQAPTKKSSPVSGRRSGVVSTSKRKAAAGRRAVRAAVNRSTENSIAASPREEKLVQVCT